MKSALRQAMLTDGLDAQFAYVNRKGHRVIHVVKPIRFIGQFRFLALCRVRDSEQQFELSRCENVGVINSQFNKPTGESQ